MGARLCLAKVLHLSSLPNRTENRARGRSGYLGDSSHFWRLSYGYHHHSRLTDLNDQRGRLVRLVVYACPPRRPRNRTGSHSLSKPAQPGRKRLLDKGLRTPDVRKFLEPAERLSLDSDFWRRQSDGLAVFFTDGKPVRLPPAAAFCRAGGGQRAFSPQTAAAFFSSDGQFYILALSQNQVRLLKGSRHTVDEIELENLPKSLAEALPFEQFEKQLQFHTGTTSSRTERAGVFHGHDPRDDDKDKILRWFHKIDAELSRLLAEERAPVVLAGVEFLFSLYEEANSYPHLLKEGVKGNPDELKPSELHEKAWPVVQPIFSQAQHKAASQYEKLCGSGGATTDVKEALLAAHHGRVDTLFVALGVRFGAPLIQKRIPSLSMTRPNPATWTCSTWPRPRPCSKAARSMPSNPTRSLTRVPWQPSSAIKPNRPAGSPPTSNPQAPAGRFPPAPDRPAGSPPHPIPQRKPAGRCLRSKAISTNSMRSLRCRSR
jgi:hypothetical protein